MKAETEEAVRYKKVAACESFMLLFLLLFFGVVDVYLRRVEM